MSTLALALVGVVVAVPQMAHAGPREVVVTATLPGGAPANGAYIDMFLWDDEHGGWRQRPEPGGYADASGVRTVTIPAYATWYALRASHSESGAYPQFADGAPFLRPIKADPNAREATGVGTNVEIELKPGARVSGTVTTSDGSPAPGMYIAYEYVESDGSVIDGQWGGLVEDPPNGTYDISGLAPGRNLVIKYSSSGYVTSYSNGARQEGPGAMITLTDGTSELPTVKMAPAVSAIGTLREVEGRAVDSQVYMWAEEVVTTGGKQEFIPLLNEANGDTQVFGLTGLDPRSDYVFGIKFRDVTTDQWRTQYVGGATTPECATVFKKIPSIDFKLPTQAVNFDGQASVAPFAIRGSAVAGETVHVYTSPAHPSRAVGDLCETVVGYQWLRDGSAIGGATGPSYNLGAADVGKKITVRVTGSLSGYRSTSRTSAAVGPVAKAPTAPAAKPKIGAKSKAKISGTVTIGKTLKAKSGGWKTAKVKTTYQWLRNGKAIKGAKKSKYTLKAADVGKRISVRVTGSKSGHAKGVSTSKVTRKVAKAKAKVTVKVAKSRKTAVVRIKTAGNAKPTGTVTVKVGKKTVKVKLKAAKKGKVTVRLPRLARGKNAVKVSYKPSGKTAKVAAKGSAKTIKVTRR